jgi:hypothetical protein
LGLDDVNQERESWLQRFREEQASSATMRQQISNVPIKQQLPTAVLASSIAVATGAMAIRAIAIGCS